MHAAVVRHFNQPPRYEEFDSPVASGEHEELVDVLASGLHPRVRSQANGSHYSADGALPFIPGIDGVGRRPDGSHVYFVLLDTPFGAMAAHTVIDRRRSVPLPSEADPVLLAAAINPGMSSWIALQRRIILKPGESVLILGATGVAGQLAIQAARYLGAGKVIAAGRNLAALKSQPVDALISLTDPEEVISEAFASQLRDQGIDVVIDYLWGRTTELFLGALAKGFRPEATQRTRLVEVGAITGNTISLPASTLRSVDLSIQGSGFGSVPLDQIMSAIPEFFSLAAQGHLGVAVESVPLSQVEQAWSAVEKGKRIVFSIDTR